MKRSCFALSIFMASLSGSLLWVDAARSNNSPAPPPAQVAAAPRDAIPRPPRVEGDDEETAHLAASEGPCGEAACYPTYSPAVADNFDCGYDCGAWTCPYAGCHYDGCAESYAEAAQPADLPEAASTEESAEVVSSNNDATAANYGMDPCYLSQHDPVYDAEVYGPHEDPAVAEVAEESESLYSYETYDYEAYSADYAAESCDLEAELCEAAARAESAPAPEGSEIVEDTECAEDAAEVVEAESTSTPYAYEYDYGYEYDYEYEFDYAYNEPSPADQTAAAQDEPAATVASNPQPAERHVEEAISASEAEEYGFKYEYEYENDFDYDYGYEYEYEYNPSPASSSSQKYEYHYDYDYDYDGYQAPADEQVPAVTSDFVENQQPAAPKADFRAVSAYLADFVRNSVNGCEPVRETLEAGCKIVEWGLGVDAALVWDAANANVADLPGKSDDNVTR